MRQDAQKTDSVQSNKNLLLSDHALVHSNPQLEIHADDVKCAHGATVGELDADTLFYLRSRGMGAEDAAKILTRAFANQVVDALPIAAAKPLVERWIDDKLRDVIGAPDR